MLQYITQGRIKCDTPTGQVFIIQANVLKSLKQFIQLESDSPESGGILIGRTDIETKAKIIESFTSPMEGDCQTRMSFFRSKSHQYALIQAWNESKKFYNLLGKPKYNATGRGDVGEELSHICREKNYQISYLKFDKCEIERWELKPGVMFGNGSIYEDLIFHNFHSASGGNIDIYIKNANKVLQL